MNYDNTNRGVLFKNDRKEKDTHPDYTGKLDVEGTERYLSAWIKESKNGRKFMSVSLGKPTEESAKPESKPEKAASSFDDFDGQEIPF